MDMASEDSYGNGSPFRVSLITKSGIEISVINYFCLI